jgi:hypothetical protein
MIKENTTPSNLDPMIEEEESFVTDYRAAVRPAQRVEEKLVGIMQTTPLLLSQLEAFSRPNER